jgi:hypothetical protein
MIRSGSDMDGIIGSFTSGIHETLGRLLEYGKKRGEFAQNLDVGRAEDVFYAAIESAALRIVLGIEREPEAAHRRLRDIVRTLSVNK